MTARSYPRHPLTMRAPILSLPTEVEESYHDIRWQTSECTLDEERILKSVNRLRSQHAARLKLWSSRHCVTTALWSPSVVRRR